MSLRDWKTGKTPVRTEAERGAGAAMSEGNVWSKYRFALPATGHVFVSKIDPKEHPEAWSTTPSGAVLPFASSLLAGSCRECGGALPHPYFFKCDRCAVASLPEELKP